MLHSEQQFVLSQINDFTDLAESFGISVEFGTDFSFFCSIPKRQPERHFINPIFDPRYSELDASNAFWMICRNSNREIVHTQAIKLLRLNEDYLDEYFRKNIWDLRPRGYHYDPSKTTWHLTPSSEKISGLVTYHGELWMKGGPNGFRGGCLTILLTRLMLLKAIARWSPDFMFGFQSPLTTSRGLAAREGYMRIEQRSILWYQYNCKEPMEDWLVWMNREEALFNLRLPAYFFYDLFEKTRMEKAQAKQIA